MNYELSLRFSELSTELTDIKAIMEKILRKIYIEEVLWDNSDMIRNWNVSERTLAEWRRKKLITYVKVNGKIWYTQSSREIFIKKNSFYAPNSSIIKRERRVKS